MSTTPYLDGAEALYDSGLGWPIPSQFPFEKFPPVSGYTGRHGIPTGHQMEAWTHTHADSNLLLRVRKHVIGVDVDDYDDKHGGDTLEALEATHGPLLPTFRSSARDGVSGIYFFHIEGWMDSDYMRDPGEHIEVIRHRHRYAVVAPSWHSTARRDYEWHHRMPNVTELDVLPVEWYQHLTRGCTCYEMERAGRRQLMSKYRNRHAGVIGQEQAMRDFKEQTDRMRYANAGNRNEMLSGIAGRTLLHDVYTNHLLTYEFVERRLLDAALEAGLDEHEVLRTIESARDWAERTTG